MEEMASIRDQLIETFRGLLQAVIATTPKVVVGIALLLLALLVAKVIEIVLRKLLVRLGLDEAVGKSGIDRNFRRVGLRRSLTQLIPRIIYFLLLILFAKTTAEALGLVAISHAIGSFLEYVPNMIAGILILVLGSAAGQYVGFAVSRAAEGAGLENSVSIGRAISALIIFIAGIMALGQLRVETDIIRLVTTCALAGVALAFALSFGLGTREIARNIIAGFYARKIFRLGEEIEISGQRGVLTAITPTQTLLDVDGRTVAVSNSAYIDEVVTQ